MRKAQGQSLPIAALAIAVIAVLLITFVSLVGLYFNVRHLQDAVNFAAEIAARPADPALVGGNLQIDTAVADPLVRSELLRSLEQIEGVVDVSSLTHFVQSEAVVVEVINPSTAGGCLTFRNGSHCYQQPAVRVQVTLPLRLMLLRQTIRITRASVTTTSAQVGAVTPVATLVVPTSFAIPTLFLTAPAETPPPIEPTFTPSPTSAVEPTLTPSPTSVIGIEPTFTPSPTSVIGIEPTFTPSPTSAVGLEPTPCLETCE